MRHKFVYAGKYGYPEPGDLIRNADTNDTVNIVLSLSDEQINLKNGEKFKYIRSVRYAKVNHGSTIYLNGKRSRSFEWYGPNELGLGFSWSIVKEVVEIPIDDFNRRQKILEELKDVDTSYKHEKPIGIRRYV
jgi:hypothetical protein